MAIGKISNRNYKMHKLEFSKFQLRLSKIVIEICLKVNGLDFMIS